jgi:hypothetical protein
MAYPCSGVSCPRLNYWANPTIIYTDGQPMGNTSVSHDARVLIERASVLSEFRPAPGPGPGSVVVTNTGDYPIPDNTTTGVLSPLTVDTPGNAGTVTVDVRIIHTYIGDLVVDLIAPDNTVYNLHNRSGGSADNLIKTYTVNVGAKSRVGTWGLRVVDRASTDVGYIDSWTFTSP